MSTHYIRNLIREELKKMDLSLVEPTKANQNIEVIESYEDGRPKWIKYSNEEKHDVTRLLTYKTKLQPYFKEEYEVLGHYPCLFEKREIRFNEKFVNVSDAILYFNKIKYEQPFAQVVLNKRSLTEILIYQ